MKSCSQNFLKYVGKFFKWVGIALISTVVLFLLTFFIARTINTIKTKITTENGIQEDVYVEIGGIKQYIQIRGEDINNPVILFLHGGPASPHAYVSYYYQAGLQSDYTIVNWDQRGCGRTYYANLDLDVDPELTPEILLNDLDELVDYITDYFKQDQIIIMGGSWGTILGSIYIDEYPEKVSSYIGVGQVVNTLEGDALAVNKANKFAEEDGNQEYLEKVPAFYSKFSTAENYEDFGTVDLMHMRQLTSQYLPSDEFVSTLQTIWLGISSPDISITDMKWFTKVNFRFDEVEKLNKSLLEYILLEFNIYDYDIEYEVPVYFISGAADWVTPYPLVEEYYETIKAPDKEMIIIEDTGHAPFFDDPEAFTSAVKSLLNKQ